MAKKNRSTFQKHYKEQARQQKQQAKAARRLEAKQRRATAESGSDDTTPDAAGMRLGLQPLPVPGAQESDPA
jgi:hypothetical protein